jgi:hypothetical protein
MWKLGLVLILFACFGCKKQDSENIDFNEIAGSSYALQTSFYGIRVEIDKRIHPMFHAGIIQRIDQETMMFYACQFQDAEALPMSTHSVVYPDCNSDGQDELVSVQPIDNLRVYVTPKKFFCINNENKICDGQHFPGLDLIIVEQSLKFLGHEQGHREGMCADHSNQDDFASCVEETKI